MKCFTVMDIFYFKETLKLIKLKLGSLDKDQFSRFVEEKFITQQSHFKGKSIHHLKLRYTLLMEPIQDKI